MCPAFVSQHFDVANDHLLNDLGLVVEQYLQVRSLGSIPQKLLKCYAVDSSSIFRSQAIGDKVNPLLWSIKEKQVMSGSYELKYRLAHYPSFIY